MQTVPLYVCVHVRVCVCVCVCLYANILAHMPSAIIVAATWASNFRSPAVHSSELAARSSQSESDLKAILQHCNLGLSSQCVVK